MNGGLIRWFVQLAEEDRFTRRAENAEILDRRIAVLISSASGVNR